MLHNNYEAFFNFTFIFNYTIIPNEEKDYEKENYNKRCFIYSTDNDI